MNEPSPTKRQIRTLRVLLRQYGIATVSADVIEEELTEAIKQWMAIHWVGVPWCDEHDAEMVSHTFGPSAPVAMFCAVYAILETNVTRPCRLQAPAKVVRINE